MFWIKSVDLVPSGGSMAYPITFNFHWQSHVARHLMNTFSLYLWAWNCIRRTSILKMWRSLDSIVDRNIFVLVSLLKFQSFSRCFTSSAWCCCSLPWLDSVKEVHFRKRSLILRGTAHQLLPTEPNLKLLTFEPRRTDGPYPLDSVDELEMTSLKNFEAYLAKNPSKSGCTLETAVKRMEWYRSFFHSFLSSAEFNKWNPKMSSYADLQWRSDLPEAQRKEYIQAVLCLQSKPPISPRDLYPGALNRYDDFVATHESLAMELHSDASSLHHMFQKLTY